MQCHRIEALIELLKPVWLAHNNLNLTQMLTQLADEAGFDGQLSDLTDDVLIYHLKMRGTAKDAMIPGIQKDCEDDFKSALLKARSIQP